MTAPSEFKIALACGTAGAYVDVTEWVVDSQPVTESPARTSGFDDTAPQVIAFTLANPDGRFTPDNPGIDASVVLPVEEGMKAVIQISGPIITYLVEGEIRSVTPFFLSPLPTSGQVRIVFTDMVGKLARTRVPSLPEAMVAGISPYLYWPLTDPVGSAVAAEYAGGPSLASDGFPGIVFGGDGPLGTAQLTITNPFTGPSSQIQGLFASGELDFDYTSGSLGFVNCYVEGLSAVSSGTVALVRSNDSPTGADEISVYLDLANLSARARFVHADSGLTATTSYAEVTSAAELSVEVTWVLVGSLRTYTVNLYIDGSLAATASRTLVPLPTADLSTFTASVTCYDSTLPIGHVSHTSALTHLELVNATTADKLLAAYIQTTPGVTLFGTIPSPFSSAPVMHKPRNASALDLINDIIRTEQGYIYAGTGGTLLSPVTVIRVRGRERPVGGSGWAFDRSEIDNAPEFQRSVTNMLYAVTVNGPTRSATAVDADLTTRSGSASGDASILNTELADLLMWGQDRLIRGTPYGVPVVALKVDARSLGPWDDLLRPLGPWDDLLAIRPGDTIRVTGLPSQLGSPTFDGWVVGKSQSHTLEHGYFTFYLDPVLPRTALFDTDLFMADGALTLSAAIASAGATTMSVVTSDTTAKLETAVFPYTLIIDDEQVTVTACTSATPQVATITRGVNGTTATTHSSGSLVETADPARFAF